MAKVIRRYYKKIDKRNSITIPRELIRIIKEKEYFLEYYSDGSMRLIPIKKDI